MSCNSSENQTGKQLLYMTDKNFENKEYITFAALNKNHKINEIKKFIYSSKIDYEGVLCETFCGPCKHSYLDSNTIKH